MAPAAIQRGDIFWTRLDPTEGTEQTKTRPCLVISADKINRSGGVVIVVPLTTKGIERADQKHRILIREQDKLQEPGTRGCPGNSLALIYQLRAIDPARFVDEQRVARVTVAALGAIEAGLIYVMDIY
jgi:mRNA-degrading endonuclease toxin of MazEF toxin-antitoxin module